MAKTAEEVIYELYAAMDFELLIIWADLYKVAHHEEEWLSSDWSDQEDGLRQEVADAAIKVFEKGSKE